MSKEFTTGASSLRNSLNTGIVYLGGLYTLQMINGFVSVPPLTFHDKSLPLFVHIKIHDYFIIKPIVNIYIYIANPPLLLHDLPC